MYFYTSSLLGGKLPQAFAPAVGRRFCDAQCQLERQNGIASPVGLSLRQFRMPKYWIRHAGAEAPVVSCCVMGDQ